MIRTSFFLPEALHQDLRISAQQEGISLTNFVRDLLAQAMNRRRKAQVKRMYTVLRALEGQGRPDVTDASTTIDDVLYGENGAWKGRDEKPV